MYTWNDTNTKLCFTSKYNTDVGVCIVLKFFKAKHIYEILNEKFTLARSTVYKKIDQIGTKYLQMNGVAND